MSEDHVSVKDMYEVAPLETHKPWANGIVCKHWLILKDE